MHPNKALIKDFYEAFAAFRPSEMQGCYHRDIVFSDPAFGVLNESDVSQMWHMLIHRGKPDLKITLHDFDANEVEGHANWEANYLFSLTNRKVNNRISATFQFEDGKIIKHDDEFDFHRWAKMAFGWKGQLLGGTKFFQNKIRKTARRNLKKWIEQNK